MRVRERIAQLPTPLYLLVMGGLGILAFYLGRTVADVLFYLTLKLIGGSSG